MKKCQFQYKPVYAAVAAILGGVVVQPPASAAEGASDKIEEVTVTGSRIMRRDFESSSPIVTVGTELFDQNSNVAVEKSLNQLPQFVPSQTMFSSADVQPSAFNNPGIVTLNLRGLGANRNLVLVDGRRPQPANAQLVVDINSIPAAAIESVEIISGGASATYGADAMGGVTNFKMKRNFQGLSVTAQTSFTEEGGGRENALSALMGGNFADNRGNATLGISWTDRQALMARDRQFYVDGWRDPNTTGGNALSYSQVTFTGNVPSTAAWQSLFGTGRSYSGESVYVNPDGTLFLNSGANPGVGYTGPINDQYKRLGSGTATPGAISMNNVNAAITTPLTRYSIFGNAHYDLSDKTTVFMQANMSSMKVDTVLDYAPATSQWNATIPRDSRAIPAQLATLLNSRNNVNGSYGLSRTLDFAGPRSTQNTTDTYQVLAGIKGKIFDTNWNYEGYVSHGKTSLITEMTGFPGLQNYRSVVTAANFGAKLNQSAGPPLFFELKCTSGLPIFSYFTPSDDCLNSINGNMKHLTETKQDIAELNVTGDLFNLPAGTVSSAWGADWRQNSYRWRPDDQLIRSSTNYPIGLFPTSRTQGQTNVKELYGELLVPLLKGVTGFQKLDLELGGRWSDYNTAGQIWTYKALLDWTVVDNVRLRGGYQMANRAPNVSELYTGATTSVVGFPGGDPCLSNTTNKWGNTALNTTNRAQVIALCGELINRSLGTTNASPWYTLPNYPNNIVGPFPFNFPFELANITGNPNLKNEQAKTWTMGVVFASPFEGIFSKASLSVDWYQIKIKNAIAPTNAWSVYAKCLNQDGSNPNYTYNEYCALIKRDGDGYRATVDTPYFNLGGLETSGIDVQLNWQFPVFSGRMTVNSVVNMLDYYRDQTSPTDPFIESKGTLRSGGQYDYRLLNTLSYSQKGWSAGVRHRFLPSIKSVDYATNKSTTVQGAESYSVMDAFGSYTISGKYTLRGGIDNFLNVTPPVVGRNPGVTNATGVTLPNYYDVLGRRYYLSLQMSL